jgi:hypothetical protein
MHAILRGEYDPTTSVTHETSGRSGPPDQALETVGPENS